MNSVKFREVSFSYRSRKIIDQLSFDIIPGELVGLMGSNGAGKTTAIRLAAGLLIPESGNILIGDRKVISYSGKERSKLVAYLPQSLEMQVPFRVEELVKMGMYADNSSKSIKINEAINTVGLQEKVNSLLMELSGGEQRRAYIAMTLVQGAKVLLLDEPMTGLDIKYQFELYKLLKHIAADKKVSVLMSLHDTGMAAMMDRLIFLKNGAIVASGNPIDLLTDETIQQTYDLDASYILPVKKGV